MYKRLKRKELFDVVRACVVSSPAANGDYLRSTVNEYTKLETIGIVSYADVTEIAHEVGRRIGYYADCSIIERNLSHATLGDIVSIFENAE